MDILNYMNTEGADLYYTTGFRDVLEDHLELFKAHTGTTTQAVEPNVAYRFEYDLGGYLTSLEVPLHLHWLTMRMNGWYSEIEFYNPSVIILPYESYVTRVKQMYEATTSD